MTIRTPWMATSVQAALIAALVLLAVAGQVAATDKSLDDAVNSLEPLINTANVEGLEQACGELASIQEQATTSETRYALAYCRYRLGTLQMGQRDAAEIGAMLAEAQKDLESVIESAEPKSTQAVEAMSLLSGIMGFRIGVEPALGMSLGARSGQVLSKAMRFAPDNPRVHLQDGISKYNTPKMWGGSVKKAEASLRKAVALFAEQQGSKTAATWPNWGYLDSLAWLGQALAAQDKIDEARAAYQQALAINPEMGWVRYRLLPALEGK